jgi:hypothetical protein
MRPRQESTRPYYLLFKARRLHDVALDIQRRRGGGAIRPARGLATPPYLRQREEALGPLPVVEVRGRGRRALRAEVVRHLLGEMKPEVFREWQGVLGRWRA